MPNRTLGLIVAALAGALVLAGPNGAAAAEPRGQRALVVLIGQPGESDELRSVLSELLERQGVIVEYETRTRFSPDALLSESPDTRVWVFISEPGPHAAKLYFRGPTGQRFLLRRLVLKNGLDELGRELIGQVVETSTVALLRSDAGVTREEARAGMSDEDDQTSPSDRALADLAPSPGIGDAGTSVGSGRRRFQLELDARGFARWAGKDLGLDHGVGGDVAVAFRPVHKLFFRARAGFEDDFGQSIETSSLDADLHATSLRAGVDVGTASGPNAFSIGLLAGADFTKTTPKASADPTLALAGASAGTVPVIRLEARYEIALGVFRATAGLFADASLADTHYDVRDPAGEHRVAAPWPVRPGAALTLGVRTGL